MRSSRLLRTVFNVYDFRKIFCKNMIFKQTVQKNLIRLVS